jgi:hypothetical protein
MTKDRVAQITVRGLNKMTKREAKAFLKWLNDTIYDLSEEVEGPWLVKRKQYAPVCRFSLMAKDKEGD